MRPRGELFTAVQEAVRCVRKATNRALFRWLTKTGIQTTQRAVRMTVENMVRYGHLVVAARVRVPWSRRPVAAYALPVRDEAASAESPIAALLTSWGRMA